MPRSVSRASTSAAVQLRRVRPQRRNVESPGLPERLHVHAVRHDHREHVAQRAVYGGEDLGVVDHARGPGLRHQQPARVELAPEHLVEGLGVKQVRRAALHGVG